MSAPSAFDVLTQKARPRSVTELEPRERSIVIGIICTIIVHLIILLLAPQVSVDRLSGTHSNLAAVAARKNKVFNFELEPLPPPPKKPDPFKFVETNPDAPANEPDKTNFFSNRNQQSAQREAAKEKDPENRPSITGRDEIKSDSAIVSGDHSQPQQGAAVTPNNSQTQAEQQQSQQARAEQIPLSGFEKSEGKSPDGIGSNISHNPAAANGASELVEGAKESKNAEGGLTATTQTSKPTPKPRPRLTAARSTVLANRTAGTTNVGVLGQDARWSEYGDYLQELIEVVDREWHGIVEESNLHYRPNSHVTVTFTINPKGEVKVTGVENFADDVCVGQCESAITNPAPYRKWTEQMIAVLGQEQTLTFGFYYY